MDFEKVQSIIETILIEKKNRCLTSIERLILKGAFEGKNYSEIAQEYCCTPKYIKHDAAPKFWKLISEIQRFAGL
jgi:hypothetical protein